MILAVLAAMGVIADLCGDVPPVTDAPNPDDAAAYIAVGDDAQATGDARVAAIAYRKALALDPASAAARHGLELVCRAGAASTDDAGALLAAIARYRAGELDEAAAQLAPLAAGDGPTAAGAHLFLGLIALAHHDGGQAVRELDLAARDPTYAAVAAPLRRLARRDGRLAVMLLVQSEIDSNAELLPDTPPDGATGTPQTDEDLVLLAGATARPWRWLAVRDTLLWRQQRQLSDLDFLGDTAQLEATRDRGADHGALRYDLDLDLLAGAAYLVAHRGTVAYRHDLDGLTLGASYALRRRDYQAAAQAAFTGYQHQGDVDALVRLGERVDLDGRVILARETTADPTFSDLAGGAQITVRARPLSGLRVSGGALAWLARYDVAEPDGTLRSDVHVELSADAEVDLTDRLTAVAGVGLTRNESTVLDFRYQKLVARLGVSFAYGGP